MRNRPFRTAIAALGLLAQLLPGSVASVMAAEPVTYQYAGAEQQFVVPAGVTTIHVILVGGPGGGAAIGGAGGFGARVEGDLAVTAGTTLYVLVGGSGGAGSGGGGAPSVGGVGGFNGGAPGGGGGVAVIGGGGGGGASDLRTASGTLATRLIVAAGGGGGGGRGSDFAFGSGGNAGTAGGTAGASGASGGGPGTASAGGVGGSASGGAFGFASNGALGVGGAGASNQPDPAGGGGGAGLYGGGGGGSDPDGGGGGGGGASQTGEATNASIAADASGTPSITITYGETLPNSGTVSAQVTIPTSAACLELSTSAIDFGTLPLGAENQPAAPSISVTNCSGVSETLLASGTDASGSTGSWSLVDATATCADTLGADNYRLGLTSPDFDAVSLSTTNETLQTLNSGQITTHSAGIYTACPGSSGAGEVMTMQIVYLATE